MTTKEFLLAALNREVERSRRALSEAPKGKHDWKPHEKSMIFGYLANMVATIPSWIGLQITDAELDVAPAEPGESKLEHKRLETSAQLIEALDKSAATARYDGAELEQGELVSLPRRWPEARRVERLGMATSEA